MRTIENIWIDFIKDAFEMGDVHEKDDGDVLLELFVNHCMIRNPLDKFKGQYISSSMFIDMIRENVFDIDGYVMSGDALADYVCCIDDDEQILNDEKFVYTYPERIFNMSDRKSEFNLNQFNIMVYRLKQNKGSNRAVCNVYSCVHDFDEKDIPCLNWIQCTIRGNKLMLHVMFRSNDLFRAFPANMLLLSYLGLKFVESLKEVYPNLEFEGINYNSTSLHIYESDWDSAKKLVE